MLEIGENRCTGTRELVAGTEKGRRPAARSSDLRAHVDERGMILGVNRPRNAIFVERRQRRPHAGSSDVCLECWDSGAEVGCVK